MHRRRTVYFSELKFEKEKSFQFMTSLNCYTVVLNQILKKKLQSIRSQKNDLKFTHTLQELKHQTSIILFDLNMVNKITNLVLLQ